MATTAKDRVTLYGLNPKVCDTVKKAGRWLDLHAIEYTLHDYRRDGVDKSWLTTLVAELGWEQLVNRRGTTWRNLSPALRTGMDATTAVDTMQQQPALIKRPLLYTGHCYLIGFCEQRWRTALT